MKILVVHQFFLRDGEAGGSRFNDMAAVWVEERHSVTVLAGDVHYQTGRSERGDEKSDSGAVQVIRVPAFQHPGHGVGDRIRSYASFALNATRALKRVQRPDIVIVSSPSLPVLIPGFAAKSRWDIPLVFEVRDLWPESAITTGVLPASSPVARASYALEELGYETADHVVALTAAIRDNIVQRGLCEFEKMSVIANGVDLSSLPSIDRGPFRESLGWEGKFVVIYAGAHGIANNLETLLETADLARDDFDLLFVSVGDGSQKKELVAEAKRMKLPNLVFLDAVGKEEIYRYIAASDAGAAILQKNRTFKTVYPNKIFDYMAMGKPVLCAIEGAAAELVQTHRAGLCVRPEDSAGLLKAIHQLRDSAEDWSHLIDVVRDRFERRDLARNYLSLLETLT